ncbi:hypothetical protein [Longimicrobium sp.]|jgi:hypothetical protein|uniref:hypothetical protein n=1 Tax=Longimicrobium sp. TaxID=2029185 RepID=UPI002EDAC13A
MPLITLTFQFLDAGNQVVKWTPENLAVIVFLGLKDLNEDDPLLLKGGRDVTDPTVCTPWEPVFDILFQHYDLFSDAGVTAVTRAGDACIGRQVDGTAARIYLKAKPPPQNVGQVLGAAIAGGEAATANTLGAVKTYLAGQNTIRVYVPDSSSRGHQTTTCLLIRRIISWGYTNAIGVVYIDATGNAKTLQSLLPELTLQIDPLNKEKIADAVYHSDTLGGCDFTFLATSDGPPAEEVEFGFSGGVDSPKTNPKPICNVRYFLMLQPFQWNAANYLYAQNTTIDLGNQKPLGQLQFLGMTCYSQDLTTVTWAAVSSEIARISDPGAQAAVTCIQANCCANGATKLLMPVYGLAHGVKPDGTASTMLSNWTSLPQILALANLVLSVLEGQGQGQGVAPTAVGTVLMTLNDYPLTWIADLRALLPANYRDRVSCWALGSPWSNASVTGLANNQVLIANIGPVDAPLFNYFYLNSPLPPVFEGKGTMPVMLNSGRPYLQLSKQETGFDNIFSFPLPAERKLKVFLYPSLPFTLAGSESKPLRETLQNDEAKACFKAQNAVVWNRIPDIAINAATFGQQPGPVFDQIQNYLRLRNFIDAENKLQLKFFALRAAVNFDDDSFPANVLDKQQMFDFLRAACDTESVNLCVVYQNKLDTLATFFRDVMTPDSRQALYFKGLGDYFRNPANDKLLKGMGYAVAAINAGT